MKQGKALKHNVGIAKWYYDEIDEMTEEMTSETKKQIEPLYKRYFLDKKVVNYDGIQAKIDCIFAANILKRKKINKR